MKQPKTHRFVSLTTSNDGKPASARLQQTKDEQSLWQHEINHQSLLDAIIAVQGQSAEAAFLP